MKKYTLRAYISSFKGGVDPIDLDGEWATYREARDNIPTADDFECYYLSEAPRDWSVSEFRIVYENVEIETQEFRA